jgi:NADH-quinone oxidoreductase subunit E
MLEIASEIIVYLLIAATIGAAIGYLVCKSLSEKTIPVAKSPIVEKTPLKEKVKVEKEEEPVEEVETVESEAVTETAEVGQEAAEEEVVEIPTEAAIEKALEALDEIDEQEKVIPQEQKEAEEEIEKEEDKKPELLSSPRNGEKDKLTQIKGVGPKLEEKLNDAGIFHFDQIAAWTETDLEWLEANTAFTSRTKNEDWVSQAKTFI